MMYLFLPVYGVLINVSCKSHLIVSVVEESTLGPLPNKTDTLLRFTWGTGHRVAGGWGYLLGVNSYIFRNTTIPTTRLMNHNCSIRQNISLPLCPRGQQQRSH